MVSQPPPKRRVMVDTNVLISGIVWPRWPYEILRLARQGQIELVVCPFLIDEVYRKIKQRFPDTFPHLAEALALLGYTEINDPTPEEVANHASLLRDPYDIPLALAAINAQVEFFLTHDHDFTDNTPENAAIHRHFKAMLPGTFLREHMGWTSEQLEAIRHRAWNTLMP